MYIIMSAARLTETFDVVATQGRSLTKRTTTADLRLTAENNSNLTDTSSEDYSFVLQVSV